MKTGKFRQALRETGSTSTGIKITAYSRRISTQKIQVASNAGDEMQGVKRGCP
jgi:hypothetical protein